MNPLKNFVNSLKTPSYAMSTQTSTPATSGIAKPTTSDSPSAVTPMVKTNTPVATTPARSAYTSSLSGGLSEADVRSNLDRYNQANPQTGSTGSNANASVSNTTTGDTPKTKNAFLKSYRDYLAQYSKTISTSTAEKDAANKLAQIQNEQEAKNYSARKSYETTLDTPGMLKSGAQQAAAVGDRRNNEELADIALRESAAARTLSALTGQRTADQSAYKTLADMSKPIQVGDDYIDPTTGEIVSSKAKAGDAGFTLSPGETRYDAQGNQIASGGAKPMTAAQEAASIKQQEQDVITQQQATQSLSAINNLLKDDAYKSITGGIQQFKPGFIGGKPFNDYKQLEGLLKLGVRSLIKGQGAVSDYEGKILGDASSALGRNLDDATMGQALKDVRGVIKTNNGQITSVTVFNPETGRSVTENLSGAEIYQLVSEGNSVIYN